MTLIELLVVMVILSIVTAATIPLLNTGVQQRRVPRGGPACQQLHQLGQSPGHRNGPAGRRDDPALQSRDDWNAPCRGDHIASARQHAGDGRGPADVRRRHADFDGGDRTLDDVVDLVGGHVHHYAVRLLDEPAPRRGLARPDPRGRHDSLRLPGALVHDHRNGHPKRGRDELAARSDLSARLGHYPPAFHIVLGRPARGHPPWVLGHGRLEAMPLAGLPLRAATPGYPYQILRQPTKSAVQPLQLPEDVVVDLSNSGVGAVAPRGTAGRSGHSRDDSMPMYPNPIITSTPSGGVGYITDNDDLLGAAGANTGTNADNPPQHLTSTLYLLIGPAKGWPCEHHRHRI